VENRAQVSQGVKQVTIDGMVVENGLLALHDDGATHVVVVEMG